MSEAQGIDPMLNWDMADRLRKALRYADVSVSEMAEYLGVSRNTVGRYINGHVIPDRRTVILWSMKCGVQFGWVMDGVFSDEDGSPAKSSDIPSGIYEESSRKPSRGDIEALMKQIPLRRSANLTSDVRTVAR